MISRRRLMCISPCPICCSVGVGILSVLILIAATAARYRFHLTDAWCLVYVVGVVTALYFNSFVLVVQAFLKIPKLQLAPTGSGSTFAAQALALAFYLATGGLAIKRFRRATPALRAPAGVGKAARVSARAEAAAKAGTGGKQRFQRPQSKKSRHRWRVNGASVLWGELDAPPQCRSNADCAEPQPTLTIVNAGMSEMTVCGDISTAQTPSEVLLTTARRRLSHGSPSQCLHPIR